MTMNVAKAIIVIWTGMKTPLHSTTLEALFDAFSGGYGKDFVMTALTVRLGTVDDIKSRFAAAGNLAMSGKPVEGETIRRIFQL